MCLSVRPAPAPRLALCPDLTSPHWSLPALQSPPTLHGPTRGTPGTPGTRCPAADLPAAAACRRRLTCRRLTCLPPAARLQVKFAQYRKRVETKLTQNEVRSPPPAPASLPPPTLSDSHTPTLSRPPQELRSRKVIFETLWDLKDQTELVSYVWDVASLLGFDANDGCSNEHPYTAVEGQVRPAAAACHLPPPPAAV